MSEFSFITEKHKQMFKNLAKVVVKEYHPTLIDEVIFYIKNEIENELDNVHEYPLSPICTAEIKKKIDCELGRYKVTILEEY